MKATAALLVLLLGISWSAVAPAEEAKRRIVVGDVGFASPESVEYYAAEDVYLVTNINGSPFARDGNGFISKLRPDGSVIDLKWIDGAKSGAALNGPTGAAISGSHLFVADLDRVHVFELPSGKHERSIPVEASSFLNGVTPGSEGCVYVTDSGWKEGFAATGSDGIHQVCADGRHEAVVKAKDMGHPNGILKDADRLVVVLGSGKISSFDTAGRRTEMPAPPKGGLDGVVKLKDGRLLVSSWGASAVYAIDGNGAFTVLADALEGPADMGVDTRRNRVLIPLLTQHKVVIHPL